MKKILLITLISLMWLATAQAKVETANAKTDKYTIKYPVVSLADPAVQEAINNDIAVYVANFVEAMENGMPLEKGTTTGNDRLQYVNGATDFHVYYEDQDLLSLTFTDYRFSGGAHGMHTLYGLNYLKKTGERLPLSYFVKVTPAQLEQEAQDNLYSVGGNKVDYTWKNSVKRVPTEFFLTGAGTVNIIFTPYELGPYAYGSTYIKLTADKVQDYNNLNK